MTDGDAAVGDSAQFRPQRRYRQSRWRRPENAVMGLLVGAGLIPHSYLLTTRGRRTGQTSTSTTGFRRGATSNTKGLLGVDEYAAAAEGASHRRPSPRVGRDPMVRA